MSDGLPIYTHERVLGVDIGVWQRDGDRVNIKAVGSDKRVYGPDRRYLAAWARRSLF